MCSPLDSCAAGYGMVAPARRGARRPKRERQEVVAPLKTPHNNEMKLTRRDGSTSTGCWAPPLNRVFYRH